jgi:hypothetical protein
MLNILVCFLLEGRQGTGHLDIFIFLNIAKTLDVSGYLESEFKQCCYDS